MKKSKKATLILLVISCLFLFLGPIPPSYATSSSSLIASFSVIPGGRLVSYQSKFEMRVGLQNPDHVYKSAKIYWLLDENPIGSISVSLTPADDYKLLRNQFVPSAKTTQGAHTVGATVMVDGKVINEQYRIVEFIDSTTPTLDIATVGWIEPCKYRGSTDPEQHIISDINDMHAMGIDTLVIGYTELIMFDIGPVYKDSSIPELTDTKNMDPYPNFDFLDTVYSVAEQNGMDVYVGPGRGNTLHIPVGMYNDPTEYSQAIDLLNRQMNELWNKFGHYKSFYGWYTPHEASDFTTGGGKEIDFFDDSYRNVKKDYPVLPILTAPMGDPNLLESARIDSSLIDVIAPQDAVGAGYDGTQYTYDQSIALARINGVFSYAKSIMDATSKHYWSDTEIWEMDGTSTQPYHYGDPYPAAYSRVQQQMNIEKNYVSAVSLYAYGGFMLNPAANYWQDTPANIARGQALYTDYKNHVDAYFTSAGISPLSVVMQTQTVTTGKTKDTYLQSLPKLMRISLSNGKTIKVAYDYTVTDISPTEFRVSITPKNAGIPRQSAITQNVSIVPGYVDPTMSENFPRGYDKGYVMAPGADFGALKVIQPFDGFISGYWALPAGNGSLYNFNVQNSGLGQAGSYGVYTSSANTIHNLQYDLSQQPAAIRNLTGASELWLWVDYSAANGTLLGLTIIDGDNTWFLSGECSVYQNGEWNTITKAFNGGAYLPTGYVGWVRFPIDSFSYAIMGDGILNLDNVSGIQINVLQNGGTILMDTLGMYDPNAVPEPIPSDPHLNSLNRTTLIGFDNVPNYMFPGASAAQLTGFTGAVPDTAGYAYDPHNPTNHFLYTINYGLGQSGQYLVYAPVADVPNGISSFMLFPSAFGGATNYSGSTEIMVWIDMNNLSSTYFSIGIWENDSGASELWDASTYYYQQNDDWISVSGSVAYLPSGYKGWLRIPLSTMTVNPYFTQNGVFNRTNVSALGFTFACSAAMNGQSAYLDSISLY